MILKSPTGRVGLNPTTAVYIHYVGRQISKVTNLIYIYINKNHVCVCRPQAEDSIKRKPVTMSFIASVVFASLTSGLNSAERAESAMTKANRGPWYTTALPEPEMKA